MEKEKKERRRKTGLFANGQQLVVYLLATVSRIRVRDRCYQPIYQNRPAPSFFFFSPFFFLLPPAPVDEKNRSCSPFPFRSPSFAPSSLPREHQATLHVRSRIGKFLIFSPLPRSRRRNTRLTSSLVTTSRESVQSSQEDLSLTMRNVLRFFFSPLFFFSSAKYSHALCFVPLFFCNLGSRCCKISSSVVHFY